ncbi:MAG: bifunctional 5,10-methylenetetrahydrofolate dehydrogenase/5,10-methenyltetrahydrofolate cyclohydrolase [Chloroflexi bacterium]|nr:bifunctional 5,10-methylenetetrahydrofolate dehydrogenase/5,10-methenyltetrahydrofolate cyclohydrolase [Chloroflexota bacterium]
MTAEIIDGKAIAAQVLAELIPRVEALRARGVQPGLAFVLVGENPASISYVKGKARDCTEVGIESETIRLPVSTSQEHVIDLVQQLNADPKWHGQIVQLPLPKHMDEETVIASIDQAKDVDGIHPESVGKLLRGVPTYIGATPAGVQQLLLRSGHAPDGKRVVVCGRSNLVGKPLAALLMQKREGANATVTVCHTGTRDLAELTRQADILVAAMGRAGTITADMVRDGAVVIDVGMNSIPDASRKSGRRLVGDVDFEAVSEKAAAITPVPGGVGPMTRAMLLVNTVIAAEGGPRSG